MKREEREHKEKLVALGCCACLRIHGPHVPGEVHLHHFRGGGWGRGNYLTLIPLCEPHHTGQFGVHGFGVKAFDAHYGDTAIYGERAFTQRDLLADALRATGEA